MTEVNVLKYVTDAILKRGRDVRQVFMIGIFGPDSHDIEFDIKDENLMDYLQSIADREELVLSGDGVFVEIILEDGYEGFTMFGNYWRDEEQTEDGDAFFHVNKEGVITSADFD